MKFGFSSLPYDESNKFVIQFPNESKYISGLEYQKFFTLYPFLFKETTFNPPKHVKSLRVS